MDRKSLVKAMQETAAAASAPRPLEVNGWGTVHVRAMLVSEVEAQASDTADGKDKNRFARAAARVLCDEKGVLIFDADKEEDVKLLASQPWKTLRKVLEETEKDLGN
jgi:hypothetical protein